MCVAEFNKLVDETINAGLQQGVAKGGMTTLMIIHVLNAHATTLSRMMLEAQKQAQDRAQAQKIASGNGAHPNEIVIPFERK